MILSSILLALFLILDSVALYIIKALNKPDLMLINVFVTLQSLLLAIFVVFLTIKVFRGEISDNIHKTELRFGMKRSELFVSRLFMVLTILIVAFFLILIINLIFVFTSSEFQSILGYRIYISSLAWYAIATFITFTVTLLLSVFFSEIIAGIFSVIVFVGLMTSSLIAPTVFKNQGLSQEIQDSTSLLSIPEKNYEKYRDFKIFTSLEKINEKDFKPENFREFLQNIEIKEGSGEGEHWYNKRNIQYLGLKYWENQEELKNNYPAIFAMMEDFDQYFNQPNHRWFDYEKINGLGTDAQRNRRIEPIPELLKKMKQDIGAKYQDLISVLLKLNIDVQALHALYIDYPLDDHEHWANEDKKLTEFVEKEEINPSKILFFKALMQLLESSQESFKNSNKTLNFDSIIVWDYTKEIVMNQRKNVIVNPFMQISAMFQSVNYQNYYLDNTWAGRGFVFGSTTNFYVENSSVHRTLYSEGIYVAYFAFNCLLIYLAYFKFRQNTIK